MGTVFPFLHILAELSTQRQPNMKLFILLAASASMVLADPHYGSYAYSHIERPSYTYTQTWGGPSNYAQTYSPSYNRARSFSRFNPISYGGYGGIRGTFPTGADEPTAKAALNFINAIGGSDLCGQASRAYIEAVIAGKSGQQAAAAARQAYVGGYSQGLRNTEETPCAARLARPTSPPSPPGSPAPEPDSLPPGPSSTLLMEASPPMPPALPPSRVLPRLLEVPETSTPPLKPLSAPPALEMTPSVPLPPVPTLTPRLPRRTTKEPSVLLPRPTLPPSVPTLELEVPVPRLPPPSPARPAPSLLLLLPSG